ncbi:hypothetical protein BGY98DRAFT_1104471 [Russula aff. rugulosa BPL654]|nr:hypothetical protein BGY98DRAFT_1104471 [Russula aff. rugulosa BPL654]
MYINPLNRWDGPQTVLLFNFHLSLCPLVPTHGPFLLLFLLSLVLAPDPSTTSEP